MIDDEDMEEGFDEAAEFGGASEFDSGAAGSGPAEGNPYEKYVDEEGAEESDEVAAPGFMPSLEEGPESGGAGPERPSVPEGAEVLDDGTEPVGDPFQRAGVSVGGGEPEDGSEVQGESHEGPQEEPFGEGGEIGTTDGTEEAAFEPRMSAEEADRKGGQPKKINKRFLLAAVVIVFCALILLTMVAPTKRSSSGQEKKDPREVSLRDYQSYAKSAPEDEFGKVEDAGENSAAALEEDEIPPLPYQNDPPPPPPPQQGGSGGGGGVQIPDTRNDRLQGKSISGIKGLTSTQQQYSTDYDEQLKKNAASTQQNANAMPTLEEFMNKRLAMASSAYGTAAGNNAFAMQNDQAGKRDFWQAGRNSETAGQGLWLGLNTLWQGTIFEAVLTSELNTDLPGDVTARVAKNIYSSQDGRFLLIPQNSILYGTYNSSISYAQSRAQIVWNKLIRPDGYAVDLGGMNATDAKGASGVKGFVNDHPMAYVKAILLMSVFSAINTEFANTGNYTNNQYAQNAAANAQNVTAQLGEKLIDRAMNVQPTIKIKAGTKINIITNQTMSLPPVPLVPVTQRYIRR